MPNLKNSEAWTYKPNTSNSLVAPAGANVTVTAVSYTDTRNEYLPSQRFNNNTAHIKLAKVGLTADNRYKLSALSTVVALTGNVTSSQALNVSIALVDAAEKPLAYVPFLSIAGASGPFYALPPVPIPAKYTRDNLAIDTPLVIKIPRVPWTGIKDTFYTNALALDTAQAYGVQSDYLDFGWDDDALNIDFNVEKYEFNTNGSKTTVPYSGSIQAKFGLNPNTWDRKSKILPYIGYEPYADGSYSWGVPLSGLKSMILDIDGDFNESNPGRERVLFYSLGARPTESTSLSKKLNANDSFSVSLASLQTNFVHEAFLTTSNYELV